MSAIEARGCLSGAELAEMSAGAPGSVRGDLAAHLAACTACQRRLLAVDLPERARRSVGSRASVRDRVLRALLVVLVIGLALFSMLRLLR